MSGTPQAACANHTVPGETRDSYRWVVLAVTSVGALLAALTSGTLVIALPEILRDLHTDLFTPMWIVVGYRLSVTFSGTQAGGGGFDMAPLISALHVAFGVGVVASLLGAVVSASRGRHREFEDGVSTSRRVAA